RRHWRARARQRRAPSSWRSGSWGVARERAAPPPEVAQILARGLGVERAAGADRVDGDHSDLPAPERVGERRKPVALEHRELLPPALDLAVARRRTQAIEHEELDA